LGAIGQKKWLWNDAEGKITEIGFKTFAMAALRKCKTPIDFAAVFNESPIYHMCIIEDCHLRNTGFGAMPRCTPSTAPPAS
jgi:hypothetical protein